KRVRGRVRYLANDLKVNECRASRACHFASSAFEAMRGSPVLGLRKTSPATGGCMVNWYHFGNHFAPCQKNLREARKCKWLLPLRRAHLFECGRGPTTCPAPPPKGGRKNRRCPERSRVVGE